MKNSATTKQIQEKPKRLTRAEKRNAKITQKASEQLELCRQAGAFHKEYLEIELERETAKYEALQARLAKLRPETQTIITEEVEVVETSQNVEDVESEEPAEELDLFDEFALEMKERDEE